MILTDLTRAEREAYESALIASERFPAHLEVTMRDRDEKAIGSLTADTDTERAEFRQSAGVLDGQIDVDWTEDVTHHLPSLVVSDPKGKLTFDKDAPAQGALHIANFISIRHLLWVPDLEREISCPLFWGSVTKFSHEGTTVSIEAMGKESLALQPHVLWTTVKLHKGMLITDAIKRLMREMGERRFDFPKIGRKLHKDMTIARAQEAWRVCTKLANSIDKMLYYDGLGRLRLRNYPEDPTITFTDDPETSCLLTHPSLSYDFDRVRNVVEVMGAKPEKGRKRIRAVARAHPSHPLSPEKLARNGQPRFLVETIENDIAVRSRTKTIEVKNKKGKKVEREKVVWESAIKKRKRARQIALKRLNSLLKSLLDSEYEVLPHYHLEVMDVVRVRSNTAGSFTHPLKVYSLPLKAGPGQSVGRNKKLTFASKRHRVRATGGQEFRSTSKAQQHRSAG